MALIKPGTSAGELSGKSGGSVFARNMGGTYVRGWARPTGLTDPQTRSRARVSALSQAWATLLQADRDAWNQYAAATPVAGRFGQSIHISGFNMWMKTTALMLLLDPALDPSTVTAPASPGLADIPTFEPATDNVQQSDTPSTEGPHVNLPSNTFSSDDNDQNFCWISPPVSAGVKYYKGPWNPGLFVTGDASDGWSGTILSLAPLSTYLVGASCFLRLRQIAARKVSAPGIYGPFVIVAES